MIRSLLVLSAILVALWAAVGRAAEGDACTGHSAWTAVCLYMCFERQANADCAEIDMAQIKYNGLVASVVESAGCSAYTVTIQHRATSDGDWSVAETLTFGGFTSVSFGSSRLSRFVRASITGEADCTDLSVTLEAYK